MESNLSSPREELLDLFEEFPEPLSPVSPFKPDLRPGEDYYWDGLEGFIKFLSSYVKSIQNQQGKAMANFKATLDDLKTRDQAEKKGEKLDNLVRGEYKNAIGQIKERRRQFRHLIKDAIEQKQKFLESILLQKEEEDMINHRVAKITGKEVTKKLEKEKASFDLFGVLAIFFQLLLILIYIVTTDYNSFDIKANNGGPSRADDYFSYFIHIALLVAFGYGYLLVWIKKFGFSSAGLNFLVVAFVAQWAILFDILFFNISSNATSAWAKVNISITTLINSLYASATVAISYGVIVGKVNTPELLSFAFMEVFFYHLNRYIIQLRLDVVDPGGAITIHIFGAYFGLAASYWLAKSYDRQHLQLWKQLSSETTYHSQYLSLIATLFLFVLFPSFNAALAPDGSQHRATINTFIAMMGSAVIAFIASHALRNRRFHIVDVQNATLAGGIAMACGHSLTILPGAALVVGVIAGTLSVVGFSLIQPWVEKKFPLQMYDTRGAHNLHGIPGLLGGFASVLAMGASNKSVFGQVDTSLFAKGLPSQGGFQGAGVFISLALGLVSGFFTGYVIYLFRFGRKRIYFSPFVDDGTFHVPDDFAKDPDNVEIPEP